MDTFTLNSCFTADSVKAGEKKKKNEAPRHFERVSVELSFDM